MSYINIVEMMAENFKYFGVARTAELDSIEIHSIGTAQDEAEAIASYMNQNSPGGIVHEICDAKEERKTVILLPEDNLAWADAGYGNQHSYTMELAESDQMEYIPNSADYIVKDEAILKEDIFRVYNTAVVRVAELCIKWGFDPSEKLTNGLHRVYSHKEAHTKGLASNHGDPDHIWERFGLSMTKFRRDVKNTIKSLQEPVYENGSRYKTTMRLSVRMAPRAGAPYLKYKDIPKGKKRLYLKGKNGRARIKKGVKIKCLGEHQVGKRGIYMRFNRGWILAQYQGNERVKKI